MKPEQLQDALNDIKEEYIADAHTSAPAPDSPTAATSVRKPTKKFRILTAAACLLLLVGGGAILAAVTRATTHYPPSPGPSEGVYIPPAEVPKPSATADMMGLICHNGKVYYLTWHNSYTLPLEEDTDSLNYDDLKELFPSLGTYLGETVFNIDEWNWGGPEGVVDLASTYFGNVYTLSGYDEDFRLCTVGKWYPEEGGVCYYIDYFECLSGITLEKGSDLLEDRLHLSGLLPDNLDENTKKLLAAMNDAPFVSADNTSGDSARLELIPSDNVPISFTVYKNGYIRYNVFDIRHCYMTVDPALVEYLFQ